MKNTSKIGTLLMYTEREEISDKHSQRSTGTKVKDYIVCGQIH